MATAPALVQSDGMSDSELAAILEQHEQQSIGYYNSEIAAEQENAINAYYRQPYGDEREGRSRVVDSTVSVTVDNAVAAVLKPFVSAEHVAEFEPVGPEDEEFASQATDFINYVFQKECNGFLLLHDWVKEALLLKLGVVKVYWEDKTRDVPVEMHNLDADQAEQLQAQGAEIYGPDETGLYAGRMTQPYPDGCLRVENVPIEEYKISPLARPGRTPPYEGHIRNIARSELIEMGFDADLVMALPASSDTVSDDGRANARRRDEGFDTPLTANGSDRSREMLKVAEEYTLVDYDGDGISELRRTLRVNDVILWNEEVEEGPFASLCPIPMPHKIYGRSLADLVLDDQRVSTVILRQTLDNIYLSNSPRVQVPRSAERDDGTTIDDLLNPAPGAPIRTGAEALIPFAIPFIADKSFSMLEYIEQQVEQKTGVAQAGQGIDPDTLKQSGQITATQWAAMESGRNSRIEMIARIFAETGIKKLFRLMLRLFVEHQPRERTIRLRNKWVKVDPRGWNADMDVNIAVGLGVGNKQEQVAQATTVLEAMQQVGQTPFADLIDKEKVYNALKMLFTAAGIKNTDNYLNEPEKDEQGNVVQTPPQPDPETVKAQAEAQNQQARLQLDTQKAAAQLQQQQQESALKIQLAREESAAKLQTEREKAAAQIALDRERMAAEIELERERMQIEAEMNERNAQRQHDLAMEQTKISQNRPGGDLDK